MTPTLDIEAKYPNQIIAGIDEAGRGPVAGPVVAAAVIVDQNKLISGIHDSKKLSAKNRERIYNHIIQYYQYGIGIVEAYEIDKINILQATIKACEIAANNLPLAPEVILVDGNMKFQSTKFISIVKGDNISLSIAAASIIAKVTRDRLMTKLSAEYPQYSWYQNFGYPTKQHLIAIKHHGLSEYHRKSFKTS
jgi:ribonuclease HII